VSFLVEKENGNAKDKKGLTVPVFIAGLSGLTVCALLLGVMLMAYFKIPFNAYISAPAADNPYVREAADVASKAFGMHFFGDFLQTQDWSVMANPWTDEPNFMTQYPPVPVYLLKAISWMPYFASLAVFLTSMIIFSISIVWRVTSKLDTASRVALAFTLGIATTPMLMALDRGNNVGFIGALFGLFAFGVLRNHRKTAIIALSLLIAIKIYPVVLLFVFLRKRWFREAGISILVSGLSTVVLFLITPGDVAATISSFLAANVKALGSHDLIAQYQVNEVINGFGLVDTSGGQFAPTLLGTWNITRWICLALTILCILFMKRISNVEVLLLGGYSMMFAYSAALGYNWTWAPIFLAIILNHFGEKFGEGQKWSTMQKSSPVLALNVVGLSILIIPAGWVFPNTSHSAVPYLGWGLGVLTLLVLVFTYSARAVKLRRQTVSAAVE